MTIDKNAYIEAVRAYGEKFKFLSPDKCLELLEAAEDKSAFYYVVSRRDASDETEILAVTQDGAKADLLAIRYNADVEAFDEDDADEMMKDVYYVEIYDDGRDYAKKKSPNTFGFRCIYNPFMKCYKLHVRADNFADAYEKARALIAKHKGRNGAHGA